MAAPKHRSRFLSTPSARRATLGGVCFFLCAVISIHALCEEGDSTPARRRSWLIYFYPRPLRGGRPSPSRLTPSSCYFYPRPLRGGRPDAGPARLIDLLGISIHALCEEGDVSAPFIKHSHKIFLSTPSARRATGEQRAPVARSQISIHALCEEGDRLLWDEPKIFFLISIHALCEEGDLFKARCRCEERNFYPRPLRGGRPRAITSVPVDCAFLSTPSARRATQCDGEIYRIEKFLSTPSARRATGHDRQEQAANGISIHALCEEGDFLESENSTTDVIFLSTPSARRATTVDSVHFCDSKFLSTPSARRATLPELRQ